MTAGQLREWLKELGLPTAGRKAVLIARLQAEDNDDDIRSTTAAGDDEPVDEGLASEQPDKEKEATAVAVAWKDDVGRGALAFGAVLNAFFLTAALFDYSAAVWATAAEQDPAQAADRATWLAGYAAWRADQPIINAIMLPLLVLLPLALVGMVVDAGRSVLGWRQATPLRHAIDVLQPMVLLGVILPTVVTMAIPVGADVASLCGTDPASDRCADTAALYRTVQLALVGLNVLMLGFDVTKGVAANRVSEPAREKQE